MKIIYYNCSQGISGDMVLGGLVHAGLPRDLLLQLPKKLKLSGTSISFKRIECHHLPAVSVHVTPGKQMRPQEMLSRIARAGLPPRIKTQAHGIVNVLMHAESKAHGVRTHQVHFHQLSEPDTLIDIAGAAIGVDFFKADAIMASPINAGSLAPAASRLVRAMHAPIFTDEKTFNLENATPTGCAILAGLKAKFGVLPTMNIIASGYGAGERAVNGNSSMLHIVVGETVGIADEAQEVILMETNIDDMDPRVYPYVMDLLLRHGALDVWLTPIHMKKGRPAMQISVISEHRRQNELRSIILQETTTLGVRFTPYKRSYCPAGKRG